MRHRVTLAAIAAASLAVVPYAPPAAAAIVLDPTCPTMLDGFETLPEGVLTQGDAITYLTSGGYTIRIDEHTITVTDPLDMNTVEHWGDPHENLNGKHIKDWEGSRRTLLLGDGTKITMHASGAQDVVHSTAIYDQAQNVQIANVGNTVMHSGTSLADTLCRERAEYDGETARFATDAQTGIATYDQVYDEDAAFERTPNTQPLGSTGGHANPNQINDYYDDPRLGHT